jgi:hypothetical protein
MKLPGFTAETSLRDLTACFAASRSLPIWAQGVVHPDVMAERRSGVIPAILYSCHLQCYDFDCTVVCHPILAPPPD